MGTSLSLAALAILALSSATTAYLLGAVSLAWAAALALVGATSAAGVGLWRSYFWRNDLRHGYGDVIAQSLARQAQAARGAGDHRALKKPYFVVLGPSAGGKSAVLRALGLRGGAPAHEQSAEPCPLWLGDDATFVEAAGPCATAAGSSHLFQEFVGALRRKFGASRMAGTLLVLDGRTLQPASDSRATQATAGRVNAAAMRAQLLLLAQQFGKRLPTYVVVTHADSLTGFEESFWDLDEPQRGQILGFTLPDVSAGVAWETVATYFQELTAALRTHATLRLTAQMAFAARRPAYFFPHHFADLAGNLHALAKNVFAAVGFAAGPALRGLYVCSAGRPDVPDGLAAYRPSGFALDAASVRPEQGRDYFLQDLLHKVLLPDLARPIVGTGRGLAGLWQRHRLAIASATLCLAMVGLEVHAWQRGRSLAYRTATAAAAVQAGMARGEPPSQHLTAMRTTVAALLDEADGGLGLLSAMGLYRPNTLLEPLASVFVRALHADVVASLVREDEQALQALWQTYALKEQAPSPADLALAAQRLKTHLLLTAPRAPGEPTLSAPLMAWLGATLAQAWADQQVMAPAGSDAEEMRQDLGLYVRLLKGPASLALARKPELVSRTRALLGRVPLTEALLDALLDAEGLSMRSVSVQELVGGTGVPLSGRYQVAGSYTRTAWEQVVQPWLSDHAATNDAWVYTGQAQGGQAARAQAMAVRACYLGRYVDAWRQFVDGLQVASPTGATAALGALEGLTRGEPLPLRRLFAGIVDNTSLAAKPNGLATTLPVVPKLAGELRHHWQPTQLTGPRTPADVERAFAGWAAFGVPTAAADGRQNSVALDTYNDGLIGVRNALRAYLDDPKEADALLQRVQAAQQATRTLLAERDLPPGDRPRLEALLLAPLSGIAQNLLRTARSPQARAYCSAVALPWRQLAQAYPFRRQAERDADLVDVAEFFRPTTGQLWSFYDAHLSRDIIAHGDQFAFEARFGGLMAGAFRPQVLPYLAKAREVTKALFAPGTSELSVDFDARLDAGGSVRTSSLTIDGQTIDASTAPGRWHAMTWPGPERGQGATLRLEGKDGSKETLTREGAWGLFRLLEAGQLQGDLRSGSFCVVWPLAARGEPVRLFVRPRRRETIFVAGNAPGRSGLLGALRDPALRAPSSITGQGGACAP